MIRKIVVTCLTVIALNAKAQDLSPKLLLEKTIAYHDPYGKWSSFNDSFTVKMTTPNSSKRVSTISINLTQDYFNLDAKKDDVTRSYTLDKSQCTLRYNGQVLDSTEAQAKTMSCDRAYLYKNYYTYLYGLPMKLKDTSTNLAKTVEQKTFKGKNYLVLRVTYDAAVGNDIWYFYFDPQTYAMEVYQFFKTDANGKEQPDSGEYILLSGETVVHDIKMPRVRAWHYNKNDGYLGTDTLTTN